MKQTIALAALALSALAPTLAHAGLDSGNPLHPLVGIALTGGGDKLASVNYTNGDSQDITAGGLVQLYGGVEFHEQGSPFAVQATVGYHVDSTHARNGREQFTRWPIEAIGLYNVTPKFRLGAGVRYASSPKFTSDGAAAYVGNADLKAQVGGILMGEWLFTPSMGVQVRYVHETYKLDGDSIDGSHGGVGFNYYF